MTRARTHPSPAVIVGLCVVIGLIVYAIQNTVKDPLPIFGGIYLFVFTCICWAYPQSALLFTFAACPFQNDLSGNFGPFRFSIVEVNLVIMAVAFAMKMSQMRVTLKTGPAFGPILLYIGLCISSSLGHWDQATTPAIMQVILYMVVTVVIYATFANDATEFRRYCLAFLAVCFTLSCIAFASGTAFILGLHKNGIGGSLAIGAIVAAELWFSEKNSRMKWLLGIAGAVIVAGMIFSLSRGAWMGAAVGILAILIIRRQIKLVFQLLIALVPIVYLMWNWLPAEKKANVTDLNPKGDNVRLRVVTIDYCMAVFQSNPTTGVGLSLRKEIDATNVIMVTLAETGWPGLLAFLLVHVQIARMIFTLRKSISLTDPRFSILVITGALVTSKFVHGVVDHYWSRGTLSVVWACVGVMTGLHYAVRAQQRVSERSKYLTPPKAEAIT